MENSNLMTPSNSRHEIPQEEAWNTRTLTLIGEEAENQLRKAHVLVVGVGGVGGYAAEMLARSGVGHLTLIDADNVAVSNINRQLIALQSTVGQPKTCLFEERFRDINPDIAVTAMQEFLCPENLDSILNTGFDYVVDAIDTVTPKVSLIAGCMQRGIKIISSMGAGGRLDPTKVGYFDIWETAEDGLARAVRQRLKKLGLRHQLKVVASSEAPRRASVIDLDLPNKRSSYGTLATIPSLFGIFLASHVIRSLTKK